MSDVTRVEDMPVYQRFYALAIRIVECTRDYPSDFKWLRIQVLKSSESVVANMAEGFYSQYSTEYIQCLYRCRREGRETMTHSKYARDSKILSPKTTEELLNGYENALEELAKLIASIERKVRTYGKAKPGAVREESPTYETNPPPSPHQPSTINHPNLPSDSSGAD
jgi:four helix bundle protein